MICLINTFILSICENLIFCSIVSIFVGVVYPVTMSGVRTAMFVILYGHLKSRRLVSRYFTIQDSFILNHILCCLTLFTIDNNCFLIIFVYSHLMHLITKSILFVCLRKCHWILSLNSFAFACLTDE